MALDLRPASVTEATGNGRRGRRALIRLGIAAAATGAIWVLAPEAVRATVSGPGPFLRVAAVFAAFAVWSFALGRLVSLRWLRTALVAVPAVAVTWWALTPYVVDDVVDEAFPVAATAGGDAAASPNTAGASGASDPADIGEAVTSPEIAAEPPQIDSAPAVPNDQPATPTAPPAPTAPATTTPQPSATPPPSTAQPTTAPPEPAGPVATHRGEFQGLTGHRGSGTATVYDLGDGSQTLRLEDFDVSNGPKLEIHLVPGADRRGPDGGIELGDLKGNVGNQNYELPDDLVIDGPWTVLIWCETFVVEVANATLAAT